MPVPSEGLAALFRESEAIPDGTSVYGGPAAQVVPDAIVIRPDEPWIEDGDNWCAYLEHYVAIAVVSASSPEDGIAALYGIIRGILTAMEEATSGWSWVTVGLPVIDETTGTALLAAPVRLNYRNSGEDES